MRTQNASPPGPDPQTNNAPFGALAQSTLVVSNFAIQSNSDSDAAYTNLENRLRHGPLSVMDWLRKSKRCWREPSSVDWRIKRAASQWAHQCEPGTARSSERLRRKSRQLRELKPR